MNVDNLQKADDSPKQEEIQKLKNLINSSQFIDAEKKAKRLIVEYPKSVILFNLLGICLIAQKKLLDAEKTYLKLIKIKSDFAEAYNNLGSIYIEKKENNKAIYFFEKALVYKPGLSQAHFNLARTNTALGDALQLSGKFEESIKNYKKAISNKSDYAEAHNNLGVALQNLGKLNEASTSFKKAIEIKDDYFESHNNLGNIFMELNKNKEAIECYKKAIKIKPNYVEAHSNLGAALYAVDNFDDSIAHYQEAIKMDPKFEKAYNNLAMSLVGQGRFDEGIKFYNKAFQINPKKTEYAINASLVMPTIPESRENIKFWRDKYNSAINSLKKYKYLINDPQKTINPPTFNLAYSDFNNLEIMKKTSEFLRNIIPAINYKFTKKNNIKKDKKKNYKIRLGFVSENFTDHTIGKLYKGLIKKIDRNKFELVIFHQRRTKPGMIKNEIDSYADYSTKIVNLMGKIDSQQKQIENENLDIIFYPDIGMTSSTYFLAHARLAPVQFMSWGHPETSGINTIDYFLSSSFIEAKKSNLFYNEKLICLEQIPMYFIPPNMPNTELNQTDFGISKNKNVYCCPQTLFKIHPDFDDALSKIIEKDSNAQIVMIQSKHKVHMDKLKKRWSIKYPKLNDNVLFLKNMPLKKFLSLIKVSNVLLDPFYFGAGVSFSESMVVGTPTITMPGIFMRSRIAAGSYMQMKISNPPIAKNVNHYVNLAVELANNMRKNYQLRKILKDSAKLYLFNDLRAVKQFETFLSEAYQAALSGSYLKDGHIIR